jgi:hypothetical protein
VQARRIDDGGGRCLVEGSDGDKRQPHPHRFTGREFLYSVSSVMIQGAGRDARYVVDRIAARIGAAH